MDVEHLAAELTEGLEPPVSVVCSKLIYHFAATPAEQQRRMSFRWLADLVKLQWNDAEFQAAITALTTVKEHPLTLYFVMWDDLEQREIAIERRYFKEAVRENCFIHPRTGEEVEHFEDKLIPVFRLNESFYKKLARDDG